MCGRYTLATPDMTLVELLQLSCPPELSDRGIFRHPVMGLMSLAQALRFMEDHVARHTRQIDRIMDAG